MMKRTTRWLVFLLTMGMLTGSLYRIANAETGATSRMLADIRGNVESEFGLYHPYLVTVTPSLKPYTVTPDFSNVTNFGDFQFSEQARALLRKNYFVATPSEYKQIYDVYKDLNEMEAPLFVTADALLHTFHVLYDNMLRILEVDRFAGDRDALNKALLAEMSHYDGISCENMCSFRAHLVQDHRD